MRNWQFTGITPGDDPTVPTPPDTIDDRDGRRRCRLAAAAGRSRRPSPRDSSDSWFRLNVPTGAYPGSLELESAAGLMFRLYFVGRETLYGIRRHDAARRPTTVDLRRGVEPRCRRRSAAGEARLLLPEGDGLPGCRPGPPSGSPTARRTNAPPWRAPAPVTRAGRRSPASATSTATGYTDYLVSPVPDHVEARPHGQLRRRLGQLCPLRPGRSRTRCSASTLPIQTNGLPAR